MDIQKFLAQFAFRDLSDGNWNQQRVRRLGVEREFFLVDAGGRPVPRSPDFLEHAHATWVTEFFAPGSSWTYELSACQVEHRTAPCETIDELRAQLQSGTRRGTAIARQLGLKLAALEVAPMDMPLDVYPHDARYAQIVAGLPQETLRAACRVAGTHIHRGCGSIQEAIRVHNALAQSLDELMRLGDHSNGERLWLYQQMAPKWRPPLYESPEHFHAVARAEGFEDSPRNCWHLIRISRHGTVEVRAFGTTDNIDEILTWAERVQEIANAA